MKSEKITVERSSIKCDGYTVPCVILTPSHPIGAAVIVHGYGGCKEEQLGLAWRVAEAGVIACVIDLRGHGEHLLPMDMNILDDVKAAISHFRQFDKVATVGHSLGGRLALLSGTVYTIAISPAYSKNYNSKTKETLHNIRSYRAHEAYPGQIFDVLRDLPLWQDGNGSNTLVIYGSRDQPDIVNSCRELQSSGHNVVEIDRAVHSDIFLTEETFEKVTGQLSEWFK